MMCFVQGLRQTIRTLVAVAFLAALISPMPVMAQTAQPGAPQDTLQSTPSQTPVQQNAAPAANPPSVPAAPAPIPGSVPASDVFLKLPRDLTPWGMFMAADIVVKAVMIGLAFASVLTWTIWFAKIIELAAARQRIRATIAALAKARSLDDFLSRVSGRSNAAAEFARAADTELRLSADALEPAGVKERITSRIERIEAAAGRRIVRGIGILATIGATAPFVGLFGTVWGIMNSFIGISKAHTTNLAVVAPGIAEALLATALGLVAAIPAVVMYNIFTRWISAYRALHADAAAEVLRLVSRDLDRGDIERRPAERRRTSSKAAE